MNIRSLAAYELARRALRGVCEPSDIRRRVRFLVRVTKKQKTPPYWVVNVREFAPSDKLPMGKDGAMFRIPLVVSCQASRSWSHLVLIHQIVHSIMRAAIPIARNTQCVFVLCSMKYEAQKKRKSRTFVLLSFSGEPFRG